MFSQISLETAGRKKVKEWPSPLQSIKNCSHWSLYHLSFHTSVKPPINSHSTTMHREIVQWKSYFYAHFIVIHCSLQFSDHLRPCGKHAMNIIREYKMLKNFDYRLAILAVWTCQKQFQQQTRECDKIFFNSFSPLPTPLCPLLMVRIYFQFEWTRLWWLQMNLF